MRYNIGLCVLKAWIAIICSLLFEERFAVAQSACSVSCVLTSQCPAARELLKDPNNAAAVQQLRAAYCRHRGDDVEVCCEKFPEKRSPSEDVSNHPNLRLLPRDCGYSEVGRIFGGTVAKLYEFPWMALISYNTRDGLQFQCAGSLINNRYVLTAAHCVKGLNIAGVRLGELDTRSDRDCQGDRPPLVCESNREDKLIEKQIVHSGYKGKPNVRNDIALLRFKIPANTNPKNVHPICLPVSSAQMSRSLSGVNSTIAGWGATETGQASPVLLKAHVPIHSQAACRGYYNRGLPENAEDETKDKLCVGELNKDSCGGDSGGPLILPELDAKGNAQFIQYGIVSYGPKRCGSLFPGVYTDVTRYVKWILDNIEP